MIVTDPTECHTMQAVPLRNSGSALSFSDTLFAAANILAPLYNGATLGKLGLSAQPLIACVHYLILLVLATVLLRDVLRVGTRDKEQ